MIRIKTGYRADQYCVIPDEEAHVAYYLFAHEDAKAIFSNGVALRGRDIQGIEPAWREIMGWNPAHEMNTYDWSEIQRKGIDRRAQQRVELAKRVASVISPKDFHTPLPELAKHHKLLGARTYTNGARIGEMLQLAR